MPDEEHGVAVYTGRHLLVQDNEVFVAILSARKAARGACAQHALHSVNVCLLVGRGICVPFDPDAGICARGLALLEVLEFVS